MKLLNVLVFSLSLTTCTFAANTTEVQASDQAEDAGSRYKRNNPESYGKIQEDVKVGTMKALGTCREVFKNELWNCDVDKNKLLVHKGKDLPTFLRSSAPANKEGAYLQALGSAGIMYTLTKNCRFVEYKSCACVPIDKPIQDGREWRWFGCNENLNFGETMTKHFVDNFEKTAINRKRAMLNLHNNEVARKVVRIAARRKCKCHGPSGSCGHKTCYRELVSLTEVGKSLKKKYDTAVRVKYLNNTIKPFHDTGAPLLRGREGSLVYFHQSPNYCRPNRKTGFPGMQGRECIHGKTGAQKCNRMCMSCGRKYRRRVLVKKEKCQCAFVWCCEVKCETCVRAQDITVCL